MKNQILILFILFFCIQNYGQSSHKSKEILRFRNEIDKHIKKHSIVADSIDWKKLSQSLDTLTADEDEERYKKRITRVYTKILRDKGDKHSFFRTSSQIQNHKQNDTATIFASSNYLGDNIGYIKIFGFSSYKRETVQKFADNIRNQIQQLDTTYIIRRWIIDLRNNTGGNMWPMIAGLNAIMDDGVAGYFLSSKTGRKQPWIIRNGIINHTNLTIIKYKIRQPNVSIAVLLDKNTASSGEMTAISLIGLPNSKTFGQPTAGYTSVNSKIKLKDGTELYLATGYCADRNKKNYFDKIIPDQIIDIDTLSKEDRTLEEAKKWLYLQH